MNSASSPSSAGREPSSPLRRFCRYARTASPVVFVVVSMPKSAARDEAGPARSAADGGAGSRAAASGAVDDVGVGVGVGLGRAGLVGAVRGRWAARRLPRGAVGGHQMLTLGPGEAEVARAARGDQLDDLAVGDVAGRHLRDHPAQVEAGDAVGDLEHVGHVVADQHDAEALLGQPADEVEHLAGLRDAQRRGRLVEQHDLGVPEHGLGDRHGLALAAGERRDRRPHRRHGAHRQRREGAPRGLLHVGLVEQPGLARARGRGTCSGRCRGCRPSARSW